jgi:hypothetical protein
VKEAAPQGGAPAARGGFGLRPVGGGGARGGASAAPAGPATPQSIYCASIGVDLSGLTPFELRATQMKLRRLMQLNDDNVQLEAKLQQRLAESRGSVPPDDPYFLKLIDDSSQEATIIRVTTNQGIEELRTLISARLDRDAELTVAIGEDGPKNPLDPETLRAAQVAVVSKKAFALTIIAL